MNQCGLCLLGLVCVALGVSKKTLLTAHLLSFGTILFPEKVKDLSSVLQHVKTRTVIMKK